MEKNEAQSQKEDLEKLYAFVIEQMKAGADKATISQKLVEMGLDSADATKLVGMIQAQVEKAAEEEQFTASSFVPAMVGGGLAAVVGGGIWGLIVIASGYVIGFMAWGIGLLCGFAVVLFSKGRKGAPLQVIAVLSSILGIVIGKYFTFFHDLKNVLAEKYGAEAAASITTVSEKVIQFFAENIGSMVGGFDILWVILAVITAWKIPRGIGINISR